MELGSTIDPRASHSRLAKSGRCRIDDFLSQETLEDVLAEIDRVPNWNLVTLLGGRHLDLDAAAMRDLPAQKQREFEQHVEAGARQGFQYLYETYPVYDKWHGGVLTREAPALAELFQLINSDAFLQPMRDMLGTPDIGFADAQLTCYRSGHFLSTHDDAVAGKGRVAAFVLGLSEDWQDDWGGLLEFYDADGRVRERFTPRCNTLSLFKVPQLHAVTRVAPGAGRPRLSITGWLRCGKDPGLAGRLAA